MNYQEYIRRWLEGLGGNKTRRSAMIEARAAHPTAIKYGRQLIESARPRCWCGETAELVLLRHAVDYCDVDGLTPKGQEVLFCCLRCVQQRGEWAAAWIAHRAGANGLTCRTCGLEIRSLHDVLEWEKL